MPHIQHTPQHTQPKPSTCNLLFKTCREVLFFIFATEALIKVGAQSNRALTNAHANIAANQEPRYIGRSKSRIILINKVGVDPSPTIGIGQRSSTQIQLTPCFRCIGIDILLNPNLMPGFTRESTLKLSISYKPADFITRNDIALFTTKITEFDANSTTTVNLHINKSPQWTTTSLLLPKTISQIQLTPLMYVNIKELQIQTPLYNRNLITQIKQAMSTKIRGIHLPIEPYPKDTQFYVESPDKNLSSKSITVQDSQLAQLPITLHPANQSSSSRIWFMKPDTGKHLIIFTNHSISVFPLLYNTALPTHIDQTVWKPNVISECYSVKYFPENTIFSIETQSKHNIVTSQWIEGSRQKSSCYRGGSNETLWAQKDPETTTLCIHRTLTLTNPASTVKATTRKVLPANTSNKCNLTTQASTNTHAPLAPKPSFTAPSKSIAQPPSQISRPLSTSSIWKGWSPKEISSTSQTIHPSYNPTDSPTHPFTQQPTPLPSYQPSSQPSRTPTRPLTQQPTPFPSYQPSSQPSRTPIHPLTQQPTPFPSYQPSPQPSKNPSYFPTYRPTDSPTHHQNRHYHLQPSTPFIIDMSFLQEFTSELIQTTLPSWMMYNHDELQIEGFAPESISTQTIQIGPFRLTISN